MSPIPILYSPNQKRGQVSPLIYLLLGFLVFYFMWKDVDLYVFIHKCNSERRNSSKRLSPEDAVISTISVKYLMQPPTIHYLELPFAEWLEHTFNLSYLMSPNFVSFSGVAVGFTAAFLISQCLRWSTLAGVIVYKLRDLGDSLDGILARGVGNLMLPTPGTSGYYIDGWCDIFSETALIYSVGVLIHRAEKIKTMMDDRKSSMMMKLVSRFFAPLSFSVWFLGVQSIVSAVGWNWTTGQLHLLLETSDQHHVNTHQLATPLCWLVVFFWRILNPHMLTQALLVSLLLDKCHTWVEMTKYIVTIPLSILCACSYLLVYNLKQGQRN